MTTEVQWSELQRDPRGVAALADEGDVRVRRRDGVPLLLVREDSATSAADGALSAARALRSALAHLPGEAAAEVLVEEFPWVDLLLAADRQHFVRDFVRAVGASAELGRWSVLAQVLVEWKATAAVHADPALVAELSQPLGDDLGPVPAPMGVVSGAGGAGDRVAPPARPAGRALTRRGEPGRAGRRGESLPPEGDRVAGGPAR